MVSIPQIQWPKTFAEAVPIQHQLRHNVSLTDSFSRIDIIAGVDCSFGDEGRISKAFIVLLHYPSLEIISERRAELPTSFPYVPGFLSFREIPVILEAIKQLPQMPDLFMIDGQGVAHPRRLGIAAHLGVLLNRPSIGAAKSRLIGKYAEPGSAKFSNSDLLDNGEKIGTVLRSKEKCKPLFISPGHRVSQQTSVDIVRNCITKYRLPEPTRLADKISKISQTRQLEFI